MIITIKKLLYFPIASYFRFFAAIRLRRWNPKIIAITGSNGKTTTLHLVESQIGNKAKYSHHANSSYGIPFDILDLHRTTLLKSEWISLFIKAPLNVFKKIPHEKIYVVEADCDRVGEGKFLASLLNPSVVIWLSSAKTHSMGFEHLVGDKFATVDEAISYEFGYFLKFCKEEVIINADSELIKDQANRTSARVYEIKKEKNLNDYVVGKDGTIFDLKGKKYNFKYLLPEEVFYSIESAKKLCEILNISFDHNFKTSIIPPGRGSIFSGVKGITILDSSYNANYSSMKAIIDMYDKFKDKNKWAVLGDMLEQGGSEKEEHEKLADLINKQKFQKVILLGPRVKKYTLPRLLSLRYTTPVVAYENPKEVLDFIRSEIKGGETILFKGARFMEGIIEHLLKNKEDVKMLPRREKIWDIRRKKWGL